MGALGAQRYDGVVSCACRVFHSEGFRGMYKGIVTPVVTAAPMNALLFVSYESAQYVLRNSLSTGDVELSIPHVFAAGSAAGFTSSFITGPTEMVKVLAQTNIANKGHLHEELEICRGRVQTHGLLGKYGPFRGLGLTLIREVPSLGLYFAIYEGICRKFEKSPMV